MNQKELLVLEILYRFHPNKISGIDIMRNSGGKLKRSTIPMHLFNLREKGLVTSGARVSSEKARLLFGLTDKAREEVVQTAEAFKLSDTSV